MSANMTKNKRKLESKYKYKRLQVQVKKLIFLFRRDKCQWTL